MPSKYVTYRAPPALGNSFTNLTDLGIGAAGYNSFALTWDIEQPDTGTQYIFQALAPALSGIFLVISGITVPPTLVLNLRTDAGLNILIGGQFPLRPLPPGTLTHIEINCETPTQSLNVFQDGVHRIKTAGVWVLPGPIGYSPSGYELSVNPTADDSCGGDFNFYANTPVPIGTPNVRLTTSGAAADYPLNTAGTGGPFTPGSSPVLCARQPPDAVILTRRVIGEFHAVPLPCVPCCPLVFDTSRWGW